MWLPQKRKKPKLTKELICQQEKILLHLSMIKNNPYLKKEAGCKGEWKGEEDERSKLCKEVTWWFRSKNHDRCQKNSWKSTFCGIWHASCCKRWAQVSLHQQGYTSMSQEINFHIISIWTKLFLYFYIFWKWEAHQEEYTYTLFFDYPSLISQEQ